MTAIKNASPPLVFGAAIDWVGGVVGSVTSPAPWGLATRKPSKGPFTKKPGSC